MYKAVADTNNCNLGGCPDLSRRIFQRPTRSLMKSLATISLLCDRVFKTRQYQAVLPQLLAASFVVGLV
jgi:hypothetical protein